MTSTFSPGRITLLNLPTDGQDAVNQNYVDSKTWKKSVKAASTTNITLPTIVTVDGITISNGERVLLKNQSTNTENGIYYNNSGSFARTNDAKAGDDASGSFIYIIEGTVNSGNIFNITNPLGSTWSSGITCVPYVPTSATPAEPYNSIQYNNTGVLAGSSSLTWDDTNKLMTLSGKEIIFLATKTGSPTLNGSIFEIKTQNFTDNSGGPTSSNAVFNSIAQPTLSATASTTTTNAATLYIEGSPIVGTNQTITNRYSLWVDNGTVKIDENFVIDGNIENRAGNILLSSTSAQSITHTGGSGQNLTIISTGGNVIVDTVVFNTGAVSGATSISMAGALSGVTTLGMSGTLTNTSGNILLSSATAQAITHTGASGQNLTISSTNGDVIVESVVFNGGAMSGITTGNFSGDITLSGATTQAITQTGSGNLTISSTNASVLVESVVFNGGALSGITTLAMGGTLSGVTTANISSDITLSGATTQAITQTGSGNLTISSTSANVVVESVTFTGAAISTASTIGMSGTLTSTGGGIALTSASAQTIAHTGGVGQDLTISSGGNVIVDSVIFNNGALSGVTSLAISGALSGITTANISGDITMSGATTQAITQTGSGNLTINSTNASVLVESVTFTGAAISTVSTIGMSGNLTNTAGNILLSSASGQSITHTGASGQNLTISSINGDTVIEAVIFNGSSITNVADPTVDSGAVNRGYLVKYTSVNASTYTIVANDRYVGIKYNGGVCTVTLPLISTVGNKIYNIIDEAGVSEIYNIIINCSGADTVYSDTSIAISENYSVLSLYNDGVSKWYLV
jgi:hypothetical protein